METEQVKINQLLQEVGAYLNRLEEGTGLAFELIKEQNKIETYKLLAQIAEGIEWLDQVFALTYSDRRIDRDSKKVGEIVGLLVESMENEDFLLMSDILTYDLEPLIYFWKNEMEK
jgi:hypothetical protein